MIERLRGAPGGVDIYGDPAEGTTTAVCLDDVFVAPRESSDADGRGRTGIIVGLTLFAPLGTDIRSTDQIRVDGTVYDIEGEPGSWENPLTGWQAGMSVALTRANG